jgi:hypothetical protein
MRERGDRVAFALAMWLSLIYRETGKGLLLIYLEAKEFERPCPQFKWFVSIFIDQSKQAQ